MNYEITAKVCSVSGISVFDRNMKAIEDSGSRSKGQVTCVVGLSRNKFGMKTFPSLPLRQVKGTEYRGNNAVWGYYNPLTLDKRLHHKKYKTFEVSIMLSRGKEQILIGVASLKFASAVIETEVDVPIHLIGSSKAIQILTNAKTGGKKKMFGKSECKDSFFQSNPYTMINGVRTVSFLGGDDGRKYALDKGSFIRLKCSCLPKSGKIDIVALDSLLESYENSIQLKASLSLIPSKTGRSYTRASSASNSKLNSTRSKSKFSIDSPQESPRSRTRRECCYQMRCEEADLDVVLVESHDNMRIRRDNNFEGQMTQSQIDYKAALLKIHEGNTALIAAMKQQFFAINDFGMSIGRGCLGELKSHSDRNTSASSENDQVPPDIQLLTIESNQTMPSALESPRMEEIKSMISIARTASTAIDATFHNQEDKNEEIEDKISKQESYGTEMLGSLLGVDINAIRGVVSDRLCSKGSPRSPGSYVSTAFFDDRMCSRDSFVTKGSTSTDESESCPSFDDSTEVRSKHSLSFTNSMLEFNGVSKSAKR